MDTLKNLISDSCYTMDIDSFAKLFFADDCKMLCIAYPIILVVLYIEGGVPNMFV